MKRLRLTLILPLALLAGCALFDPVDATAPGPDTAMGEDVAASAAPPPPQGARTADAFDTTTPQQRAAATAAPTRSGGETRLGATVVSLGPPAEPGLWLRTALVSAPVQGRVELPGSGKSVTLELRPLGSAESGGSEISLAAMRLLDLPLTALPELVVYRF